MHRGAEEHAGRERIAAEQRVGDERVRQHRQQAERSDARDRVAGLLFLRADHRRQRDDRGVAADAGADRNQRAEALGQPESAREPADHQHRGRDRDQQHRQRAQADRAHLDDAELESEQHDADRQHALHCVGDAGTEPLRQSDEVRDREAEQDRHHDPADRAGAHAYRARERVGGDVADNRQREREQQSGQLVHGFSVPSRATAPGLEHERQQPPAAPPIFLQPA